MGHYRKQRLRNATPPNPRHSETAVIPLFKINLHLDDAKAPGFIDRKWACIALILAHLRNDPQDDLRKAWCELLGVFEWMVSPRAIGFLRAYINFPILLLEHLYTHCDPSD
jgi:hypothetical protein